MANRWRIPSWLEQEVRARDRRCVYCGVEFGAVDAPRKERPSWEHVVNDARIITRQNIVLSCIGCNASKGAKALEDWSASSYCETRGITIQSVAAVIRERKNDAE